MSKLPLNQSPNIRLKVSPSIKFYLESVPHLWQISELYAWFGALYAWSDQRTEAGREAEEAFDRSILRFGSDSFVSGMLKSACLQNRIGLSSAILMDNSRGHTPRKNGTIHQVTTKGPTRHLKNVLFPDHKHLLTTCAEDPTLWCLADK